MNLFNGRLGGTPEAVGTFSLTLRLQSGSQSLSVPVQLTVAAPPITLDDVVGQLLKLGTRLTPDEVRYFDLLGNRNNRLDVGDFLAWVRATGVKPSADMMARVMTGSGVRDLGSGPVIPGPQTPVPVPQRAQP
jgi:hypothetical protein